MTSLIPCKDFSVLIWWITRNDFSWAWFSTFAPCLPIQTSAFNWCSTPKEIKTTFYARILQFIIVFEGKYTRVLNCCLTSISNIFIWVFDKGYFLLDRCIIYSIKPKFGIWFTPTYLCQLVTEKMCKLKTISPHSLVIKIEEVNVDLIKK